MLANYSSSSRATRSPTLRRRLTQAPHNADFASAVRWRRKQGPCRPGEKSWPRRASRCDVLWSQLDALWLAYVEPGHDPCRAVFLRCRVMHGTRRRLESSVLGLAPHIVFRFDDMRSRWIIMAPSGLMLPDEQAVEILRAVDGAAGVGTIIDSLARRYTQAPRDADRQGCRRHAAGPCRQGMHWSMPARIDPPLALLAELTHRCPLRCPYCSTRSSSNARSERASEEEWRRVFREAAALGVLQVHFCGGEPMARRDLVGADRRGELARPLRQPDHLGHAGRRTRAGGLRPGRAETRPAQLPACRPGRRRSHRGATGRACEEDKRLRPLRRARSACRSR